MPQAVILDLDSTLLDAYGKQEGSAFNFHYQSNGYHPLVCYDGLTGDLIKIKLCDGTQYSCTGVVDFLQPILDEYLNDVFTAIWKPLNASNELENNLRRQLQRSYLTFIGRMMNPESKDIANANATFNRSDILLFVETHFDKVAAYVEKQLAVCKEGDLNYRHYAALLRDIKKTKEAYYGKNADTSVSAMAF